MTTNRTSFACSNSCGDAKVQNLFNLLFTDRGLNATVKKFSFSAAVNDIEALDFVILVRCNWIAAPSPLVQTDVDNSGGAGSGVVGDTCCHTRCRTNRLRMG